MRCRPFLFGLFAAFAATAVADVPSSTSLVLVKVKPGQTTAAQAAFKKLGATVVRTVPEIGWQTIRLKTGTTVQASMDKLNATKAFAITEPDFISYPTELPNDPMVPLQYSLARMQLSKAWTLGKGDKSAIVAIVDTGVDVNHPDLKAACIAGYDTADGGDTNVMGTNPHGTHCAGIAAGVGNNGIGIAGVAYGASIMPIKVFPDGIDGAYSDAIAAGLIWAADHGADVISMSFGGGGLSQMERDALDYAYNKNVVLVAAAGNNGVSSQFFPAAYPKCIAVGATDSTDTKAGFSNFGADWVDVAAPGVGVRSTVFNNLYEDYSGTSMACPNVAGVATLIVSYAGKGVLSNEDVRAAIEENCDSVGSWVAKGRVNAFLALSATPLPGDTPVPTTPIAVDGTMTNGTSAALVSTDGFSTVITGVKKPGIGISGSMTTTFPVTKFSASDLRYATLTFSATAEKKTTLQIFLYDATASKYVLYATQTGTGAAQSFSLRLNQATLGKVFDAGEVKMLVRALVPQRLTQGVNGVTKIDQIQMVFGGIRSSAGLQP